ncbi:hypothetical protein LJ656_23370 [Paraburkholderia sp. MMS20-SJTR3]|uniref:BphX-like n=1 Tax=Paraburkholderia sejongensis TaxID=2886946 RepID=A0ABS8K057_9BURK|nr:hypothetical protein [Paraburkholderia sp. MMS20-SJTR3]MCC8395530.1 hypothetical protein [Paraburkholderia sp. MMS20-SJTR3]
MAKPVRKLFKAGLFVGLFCLAVRYVHTYPVPMPDRQVATLLDISDWLGISDPEALYIYGFTTVDLILAVFAWFYLIRWLEIRDSDDLYFLILLIVQSGASMVVLLVLADWLGFNDRDSFYIFIVLTSHTILAVCAYVAFAELWRRYRTS